MATSNRTVVYCRVSSQGQADRDTIESQRHDLPIEAELAGETAIAVIEDNGISGMTADRPGIQRVLRMAERGEFDILRVRALDRIMRADDDESAHVYAKLNRFKINIAAGTQRFRAGCPRDIFVATIFRALAALDRSELLEKMRAGHMRTARAGLYSCGRTLYGYRWDPEKEKFAIVEAEAAIVRLMYEMARTCGGQAIAWELNHRGHRTRPVIRNTKAKEGRPARPRVPGIWEASKVSRILRSRMYRGERVIEFEGEPPIVQVVPAIIDPRDWEHVQHMTRSRTCDVKTQYPREFLCANLIKCGVCGFACWGANPQSNGGSAHSYYRCSMRSHWKKKNRLAPCTLPYLRTADVDARVWAALVDVMSDPARIAVALSLQKQPNVDWSARAAAEQRALDHLAGRTTETLDLARHNLLSADECRAELARLALEKKLVTERLAVANQQMATAAKKREVATELTALSQEFRKLAKHAVRFESRRALIKRFVSIEDGGKIVLNADGSVDVLGRLPVGEMQLPLRIAS